MRSCNSFSFPPTPVKLVQPKNSDLQDYPKQEGFNVRHFRNILSGPFCFTMSLQLKKKTISLEGKRQSARKPTSFSLDIFINLIQPLGKIEHINVVGWMHNSSRDANNITFFVRLTTGMRRSRNPFSKVKTLKAKDSSDCRAPDDSPNLFHWSWFPFIDVSLLEFSITFTPPHPLTLDLTLPSFDVAYKTHLYTFQNRSIQKRTMQEVHQQMNTLRKMARFTLS